MEALTPWAADDIDALRHRLLVLRVAKAERASLEAVANAGGDRWTCRTCGHTICSCGPRDWDAVATAFWHEAQFNDVDAVNDALGHVEDDAMTAESLHEYLVSQGDCENGHSALGDDARAHEIWDAAAELWVMVRAARGDG